MRLRLFIAKLHMSEHLISIYLNYCENFYENTGLEIIHGKPTPVSSHPPELQRGGAVHDHLGRLLQRPARLVLTLGRDHLGTSLPRSLSLYKYFLLLVKICSTQILSQPAAIALCRDSGTFTSFTSTLSTVTPHGSVASSSVAWGSELQIFSPHGKIFSAPSTCMSLAMASRSDKISPRFLVPSTFLSVVAASSRAESP